MRKLLIATAALTAALVFAPVASADPNINSVLKTTCTFEQVNAAIHDKYSKAAAELDGNPMAQAAIRHFLHANPKKRKDMLAKALKDPNTAVTVKKYVPVMEKVAKTCHKY